MRTLLKYIVWAFLLDACIAPRGPSPLQPIGEITVAGGTIARVTGPSMPWTTGAQAPPRLWQSDITSSDFAYRLWHGDCTGTSRSFQCDGGLELVSTHDPSRPAVLDRYHTPQDSAALAADLPYLYLTWCAADPLTAAGEIGGGLKVLDSTTRGKMVEIGSLDTSCAMGLAVVDQQVYVATHQGLVIVDVAHPAAPIRIGTFTAAGFPTQVAILGDTAFVTWLAPCVIPSYPAECHRSLRQLDISNPSSITEISAIDLAELSPEKLARGIPPMIGEGQYLYVPVAADRWQVFRVAVARPNGTREQ